MTFRTATFTNESAAQAHHLLINHGNEAIVDDTTLDALRTACGFLEEVVIVSYVGPMTLATQYHVKFVKRP